MRPTIPILIAGLALLLGGCGLALMETPAVVAVGGIDPFASVIPQWQDNRAPVFIASGRRCSGRTEPDRFYTNERSRMLRLGRATVEIGRGSSWEELVRESRAGTRRRAVAIDLAEYEEYGALWTTAWPPDLRYAREWDAPDVDRAPAVEFVTAIEAMLAVSRRKQVTVFVHGFNTEFGANVAIAGEFWHYMARDGVMISFDWPSDGSMFSYQEDKANAEFAIRQFRLLLEFLADATTAERINIIAHSAGNPIVVETMRQLSLMHGDLDREEVRRRTRIGVVVLAAPDMDLDSALSAAVDGASRVAESVAVYASRRDKALGFASGIFGDVRLGNSIGRLTDDERQALISGGWQWIDVTNAQRWEPSFLGHSYFHRNPWVSSDVMLLQRLGTAPDERGLVRDLETGFLVFPDDYLEQLPGLAERIMRRSEEQANR